METCRNKSFRNKLGTVLSSVMEAPAILLLPTHDVKHPCTQPCVFSHFRPEYTEAQNGAITY